MKEYLLNTTLCFFPPKRETLYIHVKTINHELIRNALSSSKVSNILEPVKSLLWWDPVKDTTGQENGILGWRGFVSQTEILILQG